VQEAEKVFSKFTWQYAADEKSLHCCRKVYIRGYQTAKKVYFQAKKVYIFEEKVYIIYQKNAEKFTHCKPM
jgi:hypothetical protein